jgi:hypothetical protein
MSLWLRIPATGRPGLCAESSLLPPQPESPGRGRTQAKAICSGAVGEAQLYLEALDRDVRKAQEQPPIGILLCASENDEVVEYPLPYIVSGIGRRTPTQLPDKSYCELSLGIGSCPYQRLPAQKLAPFIPACGVYDPDVLWRSKRHSNRVT